MLSNSTTSNPTDKWVPSSNIIKPQIGDQISAGFFRNFADNKYEFSTKAYYKHMQNQIDRSIYDYFFSLDQTISQDAASPANPVSNIQGGALGYFSAHSVQIKTVEVEYQDYKGRISKSFSPYQKLKLPD